MTDDNGKNVPLKGSLSSKPFLSRTDKLFTIAFSREFCPSSPSFIPDEFDIEEKDIDFRIIFWWQIQNKKIKHSTAVIH